MELFLNAVWVIVSAMAVAGLLQTRPRRFERKQWLHLGALLCAAIILFPSISVSDDIHSEPFIVEDSRSTRHVGGAKTPGGAVPLLCLGTASWLLLLARGNPQSWQVTDTANSFLQTSPLLRDLLGRAPPFALAHRGAGS
jgi:hypothetical protein